jgi:general secretion pathway protein H
MPISRQHQHGFTLIEILIVMVIISIAASMAMLAVSRHQNSRLEYFAKQLVNTLTIAEEQAVLQPSAIRLRVTAHTLQFSNLNSHAEVNAYTIPKEIQVTVKTPATQEIIIASTGDISPFTLLIGNPGEKPRYQIISNDQGIKYEIIA